MIKKSVRWIIEKLGYKRELDYLSEIGYGTYFINAVFQRLFRINADFKYMKHFTSTVVNGSNIRITGTDEKKLMMTKRSFAFSGGCYFNGIGGGIEIGEGTIFSFNVVVISAEHDFNDYNITTKPETVKIGKDCWIGANVTILAGVEIADGCVVGAGSVVNRSVTEKNKVIAGVPARVIKDKYQ